MPHLSLLQKNRLRKYGQILLEWLIILVVAWFYGSENLLNFDPTRLPESGEHNESATFPILTEIAINRYREMPLWNAYAMTGIPYLQDPLSHFWNPISTIPVILWGAINGMKVSIFLSFWLAGLGQWFFAHVFGARGTSRLWAALLFMLSGGLAFFWGYGWYELLLGVVWFPWCFAAVWWAMRRKDATSIILAAFCIVMVLTTGGGYYPFYLLGCLGSLTITNLILSERARRWPRFLRAISIAAISAGLLTVVFLPIATGFPLFHRWTDDDREQSFSQPIPYALVNYIVSDRSWEGAEVLGLPSGWKWFYIGSIAVGAALCLAPLAFGWQRRRRIPLIVVGTLALVILAWVANRFSPVGYIYEMIPFLYLLRFPNRLLVIAASPIILLGGLGFNALYRQIRQWQRSYQPAWAQSGRKIKRLHRFILTGLPGLILLSVLAFSVHDIYSVNQPFAFTSGVLDAELKNTLTWLKSHDNSFYYINLGGDSIYWHGTSVSYQMEIPVINFDYGRRLSSMDRQMQSESPFHATPKYTITWGETEHTTIPTSAQKINTIESYHVLYSPDALPTAFSAPSDLLQKGSYLPTSSASPLSMTYDGPNRVIVTGKPARPNDQLVVLVSDFPGWELSIDGNPAPVLPANEYLGAAMLPGEHTYTFNFRPASYTIGLAISALTLLFTLILLVKELPVWRRKPKTA